MLKAYGAAICAINNIIRHTNSLKKSANLCIYILSNNKNNTHRSDQSLIILALIQVGCIYTLDSLILTRNVVSITIGAILELF